MTVRGAFVVAAAIWAIAPSDAAQAQATAPSLRGARVVIEPFAGRSSADVRASLAALFGENGIVVISDTDVAAGYAAVNIRRPSSPVDYVRAATELGAAAFVDGRIARRRREMTLTIRVRRGSDGAIVASEVWTGRGRRPAFLEDRAGVVQRLGPWIAEARTTAPAGAHAERDLAAVENDVEARERGMMAQAGTPQTDPSGEERDYFAEMEGGPRPMRASQSQHYDAFRVSGGFGTLARSFNAIVAPVRLMNMNPDQEIRSYSSGGIGHFEFGLDAEIYPGAFGEEPFPYAGVVVSYRRGLAPDAASCGTPFDANGLCPAGRVVSIPVTQQEVYFGVRGRYRFGSDRSNLELTANLGIDLFEFILDMRSLAMSTAAGVVPPVSYLDLHMDVGAMVGFVPRYFYGGARVGYRVGLDVGPAAKQIFGRDSGAASGVVLSLDLRSEAPYILEGIFFAFSFSYMRYSATYRGETTLVTPPRTNPTDNWEVLRAPVPGDDDIFRVALAIGFALD